MPPKRRICFVTGTRAEFGLMRKVLAEIKRHPKLVLQIVVTGMHLDAHHGRSADQITGAIATIPWRNATRAIATGEAVAGLAKTFMKIKPDIVLVVGDRVEPLAAAMAAHLLDIPIAHVHGGDRAMGQVDDSLRHAITKLSNIHFAATKQSAARIARLGEDAWRIHRVGSPGIEGILGEATPGGVIGRYALLVLHPLDADEELEFYRATQVLRGVEHAGFARIVIIYPNNDPGSRGIIRRWKQLPRGKQFVIHKDLNRPDFLRLLRDAAVLVGNSSAGIIEAGSFGTPVVDVGRRQEGRERNADVKNVPYDAVRIYRAVKSSRRRRGNVYEAKGTAKTIARILAGTRIDARLLRKLVAY